MSSVNDGCSIKRSAEQNREKYKNKHMFEEIDIKRKGTFYLYLLKMSYTITIKEYMRNKQTVTTYLS